MKVWGIGIFGRRDPKKNTIIGVLVAYVLCGGRHPIISHCQNLGAEVLFIGGLPHSLTIKQRMLLAQ